MRDEKQQASTMSAVTAYYQRLFQFMDDHGYPISRVEADNISERMSVTADLLSRGIVVSDDEEKRIIRWES